MINQLAALTAEIREVNEANGWFETDRTFGEDVALLHSEVSEAFEAWRQWGFEDKTDTCVCNYHQHEWTSDPGDGKGAAMMCLTGQGTLPKPEGVGSELADVFIRLLDTADRNGVDLTAEVTRKLAFNRVRGWRHGGKRI